jgi:hypothetical protein
LLFTILSTPPSRLPKGFPRRDQASQAVLSAAITAVKIGMTPFGRSAEGSSNRSFVGAGVDT